MSIGFKYYGNKKPAPGVLPTHSATGENAKRAIRQLGVNIPKQGQNPFGAKNKPNFLDGKNLTRFNETTPVPQEEASSQVYADGMGVLVRETFIAVSGCPLYGHIEEEVVEITGGTPGAPHYVIVEVVKDGSEFTVELKEEKRTPGYYEIDGDVETWRVPLCRVYVDVSGAGPSAIVLPGRHMGLILLGSVAEGPQGEQGETGPQGPPGTCEGVYVTVVTDVQINGYDIQIKTQQIKVIEAGVESAWTTIHTGTACP